MKIIHERFPYRFTENGLLETNGQPDYRIQKWNEITDRYRDMFLSITFWPGHIVSQCVTL